MEIVFWSFSIFLEWSFEEAMESVPRGLISLVSELYLNEASR